jgi:hypothetical protein
MPITPVQEFLDGGIVTVRDASLLKPGELLRAEECVYRKFDVAIHSAPGRTIYNATAIDATKPISGLASLDFPTSNSNFLCVWSGSYYYTSRFTGLSGSFVPVTSRGEVVCNMTIAASVPTLTVVSAYAAFRFMAVGTAVYHAGIAAGAVVTAVAEDGLSVTITTSSATANATAISVQFADFVAWTPSFDADGTGSMDTVVWDNHYFVLCSAQTPVTRCSYARRSFTPVTGSELVMRRAGLLPVISWGAGGAADSGPLVVTGVWSALLGAGIYWFVVTECIDPGGPNELESAYIANNGAARKVNIDTLLKSVSLSFPLLVNSGRGNTNRATHFCVYMSDKQTDDIQPPLSTFKRYAVVPVNEQVASGNTRAAGAPPIQPSYTNGMLELTPTTITALAASSSGANPSFTYVDFGNRTNIVSSYSNPDVYATGLVQWADTANTGVTISRVQVDYPGTSLPTNAAVTGFRLKIAAGSYTLTSPNDQLGGGFKAQITDSGNTVRTIEWVVNVVKDTSFRFYETGSQFDNMGWAASAAAVLAGLKVRLTASYWTVNQLITWTKFRECSLYVYYTAPGTSELTTDPTTARFFRTITYRSQIGTTICEPANFPPASATTGSVFHGHLVLNDVTEPTAIRYSLAGYPEYFPKPYLLKFSTRRQDPITCIKRVGQLLIVGMRNAIKRVNYLPTEADTDFQQGLAHEDLAVDHGIVGTHASTLFDLTGKGVILGYVAADGLYATDGMTTRPLCRALDWENTVNSVNLATCVLQEYPKEKWLVLYYNPKNATHSHNTKALIFNYDSDHVKEDGTLTCVGPITVSGRSAATATIGTTTYLLTGHETSGSVYVEDNGLVIPDPYVVLNGTNTELQVLNCPKITTRLMYAAGLERTARIERIYLRSSLYGATITITNCAVTKDSATVTKTGAPTVFATVRIGMRVCGSGVKPGTVVTTVTAGEAAHDAEPAVDASLTLSTEAVASGTMTLLFDTGTLTVMTAGEQIGDGGPALMGFQLDMPDSYAAGYSGIEKSFVSTANTTIPVAHPDNVSQGLQIHIERVRMPSDLSGEAGHGPWYVDLGVPMRLHYFDLLVAESGMETNRADN